MRTLALITDGFGGYGGIAKFNRDFLKALTHHPGCDEVIALPRLMSRPAEPLPSKLSYLNQGLNGKFRYLFALLDILRAKKKIDLIICGHINLCGAAFLAKLITGAPLVLIIHGIDAWEPTENLFTNLIAKRVDAFIAVSQFTKERFLKWSKIADERGFILPNSIDLSLFTPGPKNKELLLRYGLDGKKVIMTLARLNSSEKLKGVDEVLSVLPELAKKVSNIAYLIVGEGDDRTRLQNIVKTLGMTDRVIFTRYIDEKEKADHYRLADAYVMPSRGEGFGIVFLEALACGVPVLGSKLDASREALLEGKLGILVDPTNQTELTLGIVKVLEEPRGTVPQDLAHFTYDAFEKRTISIIDHARILVSAQKRGEDPLHEAAYNPILRKTHTRT